MRLEIYVGLLFLLTGIFMPQIHKFFEKILKMIHLDFFLEEEISTSKRIFFLVWRILLVLTGLFLLINYFAQWFHIDWVIK